jgi:hypothetical protein
VPDPLLQRRLRDARARHVETADEVEVVLARAVVGPHDGAEQNTALHVHVAAAVAEVGADVGVALLRVTVGVRGDVELLNGAAEQLLQRTIAGLRHEGHAISRA